MSQPAKARNFKLTLSRFDKVGVFCETRGHMDKMAGIIQRILGSNAQLKHGLSEARILALWPLAVGEQIAKHAQAVALKGNTIMISVNHPIWKQELHSNKRLALAKFNAKLVEELGAPPGREFWVEDLFIVNPTKEVRGFQKK